MDRLDSQCEGMSLEGVSPSRRAYWATLGRRVDEHMGAPVPIETGQLHTRTTPGLFRVASAIKDE